MATKDQVVDLIKGWLKNDKELKLLQNEVKMRRIKKKEISTQLVNIMKDNEIDCFDINDGKLVYSKSKTKQAVSKKVLLEALNKYFSDKPETANEIVDHILDSRTEKITETIKRK